jgi:hypothetical protein
MISCLQTKDIDLETLKEITKILVNMVLWRHLEREIIETACCLCDISLMICDLDMNILAMFCLNALTENVETHEYIRNSGKQMGEYDVAGAGKVNVNHFKNDSFFNEEGKGDDELMHMNSDGSFKNKKSDNKNNEFNKSQYSIFSRINYLLEMHQDD